MLGNWIEPEIYSRRGHGPEALTAQVETVKCINNQRARVAGAENGVPNQLGLEKLSEIHEP